MPELPDLCVYSHNLKKLLLNKNITSVTVDNPRNVTGSDVFCRELTGTYIRDIVREGKELHFSLANNNSFGVHLMLNGKFTVCNKEDTGKISSKIVSLFFEDGQALVAADFRGLCKVTLNPKVSKVPDALSDSFTLDYFSGVARKSAYKNVKAVLIDQKVVRGIGNAYVDEILWKADISPLSVLGKIPEDKLKDLFHAIPSVLTGAIRSIQEISPDIISGEERSFLKVHNPKKKTTDEGDKILQKDVATKRTYYTDKQKLYI